MRQDEGGGQGCTYLVSAALCIHSGSGRAFLEDEMKYLFASIAYASFFACVGFAVYWLKSGLPLFALIFMPSMSTKGDKGERFK